MLDSITKSAAGASERAFARRGIALAILAALASVVASPWLPGRASAQIVNAFDRGWYDDAGFHDDGNNNTYTGLNGDGNEYFNSFFTFNLSAVTTVSAGVLRLELESYYGPDASEDFTVYDVETAIATLNATNIGRIDIFEDLQSGAVYGTGTATPSDRGSVIEIELSAEAIADINAAAGGLFGVGVHVDQISLGFGNEGLRWSASSEPRVHQLALVPGPPPCFAVDAVDDAFSVINDGSVASLPVLANDECTADEPIRVIALPGDLEPDRGGAATTKGIAVSYRPADGFAGFEEFRYTAEDAGRDGGMDPPRVDRDSATVVVEVLEDLVPDAVDDSATTPQTDPVVVDVLANDVLGNPPNAVEIATQPSHGSAVVAGVGMIRYTPVAGFFGEDDFAYRLTDANGDSDVATVFAGVLFVRGEVTIDVMPSDAGNNLNLRSGQGAAVEVAILSAGEFFDAPSLVDPLSLKLGPRQANIWGDPRVRDVDADGDDDLVVRFLIQQLGIACGDTHVSLSGSTFDFEPISGTDRVNTFNCPRVRKRH